MRAATAIPIPTAVSPERPFDARRAVFRSRGVQALVTFALAVAAFAGTIALLAYGSASQQFVISVGTTGFGAATLLGFCALILGIRALVNPMPEPVFTLVVLGPLLGGAAMSFVGLLLTLFATAGFRRGRQLRRRGQIFLPPVAGGSGWTKRDPPRLELACDRSALADQWRDNGRTEHASVGAFAHLTLDLMVLGAPSRLITAAQRDASDEIRHAELCFALARSIDGRDLSPGAFPSARKARTLPRHRTLALAHLAVDSLIDGAFHEGLSARMIAKLVKRCDVPQIRAIVKELAADEGRHAASAWDVIGWCIAEGGAPVRAALEGAALALPAAPPARRPSPASGGDWETFGIHGDRLEADEYARMTHDLLRQLNVLLGGGHTHAHAA
jgi:hypothetical protein